MKKVILMVLICSTGLAYSQGTGSKKEIATLINTKVFRDPGTNKSIKDPDPNWKSLEKTMLKKYDSKLVKQQIVRAQLDFYEARVAESWNAWATVWIENTENIVSLDTLRHTVPVAGYNNILYNQIFKQVSDKALLLRAAAISYKLVSNKFIYADRTDFDALKANMIDSYANLLYKAGKKDEAIDWQTQSVLLTGGKNAEFTGNLAKMKAGRRTW